MRVGILTAFVALAATAGGLASQSAHAFSLTNLAAKLLAPFTEVSTEQMRFTPEQVMDWLQTGSSGTQTLQEDLDLSLPTGQLFTQMRRAFIQRAEHEARTALGGGDATLYEHPPVEATLGEDTYPYFGFIPTFEGGITEQTPLSWTGSESSCFADNKATLTKTADGEYNIAITSGSPRGFLCSDFYLLATLDSIALQTISSSGNINVKWSLPSNSSKGLQWDLANKGVRVLRFNSDALTMLGDVVDTALLFQAQLTPGVSNDSAVRNLDFLNKYAGIVMTPRTTTEVIVDESEIHSGDFFGILRLDGLDPMLAWAMGSTTGHTTTALWINGELYICESTTNAPHWPVNGIQKTPYRKWLQQVKAAGQNAVHAPLSAEARARFNETAAVEFFAGVEGLDYGFHTMLWGWIDTLENNYPCLPPDFKTCLTWPVVEVLFGLFNHWVPDVAELLYNEAFNHRLNTTGLKLPELLMESSNQGLQDGELPTIVEDDEWTYNTTLNGQVARGRSMVCCVFVASVWKHGGLFDGMEVQTGELTNSDDYTLSILDAPTRPAICQAADPSNQLCQVEGDYSLHLRDYSTRKPYTHMGEKCAAQAPNYTHPTGC